jgi:hypothetical protein
MAAKFATTDGREYTLVLYGPVRASGVVLDDRGEPVRNSVAGVFAISSGADSTVAALRRLGYLVEDRRRRQLPRRPVLS